MPRCIPDYELQSLDVSFDDGTTIKFNLEECPSDIIEGLALHGAVQLVAAAANRADDHESAFEYADDVFCHINESFPSKRPKDEPRNIVIHALARIKEWPLDQASLTWSELSLEKQRSVRKLGRVKREISRIRDERKQHTSESATMRKKHYTHKMLTSERKAMLQFSNGKDLEINLDNVSSVSALAVYGAKQKVADSYAGERNCQNQIESARQMINALYMGHWTAKSVEIAADAPTGFAPELVSRLVDWMRWPRSTVESVVRQFDEEDQAMLLNPGTKQALATCAREASMEQKPGAPSPREMLNLLDEVLYQLGVANENQEGVHQ